MKCTALGHTYLQNIPSGSATVHVLVCCIHSDTGEAASELSQLHITRHQLVGQVVILPHMQVVVATCDKLGTIIVEELDGKCEVCACGGAADSIAALHIPQHLSLHITSSENRRHGCCWLAKQGLNRRCHTRALSSWPPREAKNCSSHENASAWTFTYYRDFTRPSQYLISESWAQEAVLPAHSLCEDSYGATESCLSSPR